MVLYHKRKIQTLFFHFKSCFHDLTFKGAIHLSLKKIDQNKKRKPNPIQNPIYFDSYLFKIAHEPKIYPHVTKQISNLCP